MKNYFVYIMTNKMNGTLYTGFTNNLLRRVIEHKRKDIKGFTQKYGLDKLVWYEQTTDVMSAIRKEKQIKKWYREYTINNLNEKITLFYFNRKYSQTAFLDEFKKWDVEMDGFNFIPVIEDEMDVNWKGEIGMFNEDILKKYVKEIEDKKFYLFGSDQMDDCVKQILIDSGVKDENIITEKPT